MNMYTPSSKTMVTQEEREPSKTFSGKLPFRTKPEIHEDIFFASKQAGKSINAWMEDVLSEAAKQKREETQGSASPPSQSLQQLFQDRPDAVFELIDNIKPELKSHKTRDTVVLMGEVEKLVAGFEQIRSHLSDENPPATVELLKSATYSCLQKNESAETKDQYQFVELQDCLIGIREAIIPRLKRQDSENFLECLSAFGQFLASFVAISHHLKDNSIENTLSVMQQVISQLFP
jgi:hypothetical protein